MRVCLDLVWFRRALVLAISDRAVCRPLPLGDLDALELIQINRVFAKSSRL